MSKTAKSKTAVSKISPKDLQKKLDELTVTAEALKLENEKLRTNFKLICKKIVDNTDLSNYQFLDPNIEPDQIGINDLLHMLQTLALLAEKLNQPNDGIVNHVENLELRITELLSEQGSMFKNKLKLQERLEFIMQERDVWKRNAETIKKMYEKLVKDYENLKRPASGSSIVVGAYKGNVDSNNNNQRTFSANIPRSHYENLRNNNIEAIQFKTAELQLIKQLSQLQPKNSSINNINTSINSIPTITSSSSSNIKNIDNNNNKFQNNIQPKEIVFDKVEQLYKESTPIKSALIKPELKPQSFDKFENFNNRSLDSFDSNSQVIQGLKNGSLNRSQQRPLQHHQEQLIQQGFQNKPLQNPTHIQHQQDQLQKLFLQQSELHNQQQKSNQLQHLHQQKEQQQLTKRILGGESPSFSEKSTNSENFNELSSTHSYPIDNFDNRTMTSTRKNVSFNSAIDIRTYPKNVPKYPTTSKNLNDLLYIEDKQLSINFNDGTTDKETLGSEDHTNGNTSGKTAPGNEIHDQIIESLSKTLINGSENSNKIADELTNLINNFNFPPNNENLNNTKPYIENNTNNTKSSSNENNISYKNNNIIDRCTISSKKKLPGETPVKDLEKTLKMIIIKELSVEKVDENDWKMFAKRVGTSDADIKEWISLRLQFPMARVLSVWSSKPEATVRLLHRHLNAPCFNYTLLAKRIETFYDVL